MNFTDANLTHANLRASDLTSACLLCANLQEADATAACLNGANMCNAVLTGAVFIEANLRATDMRGAKMQRAQFSRADLRASRMQPLCEVPPPRPGSTPQIACAAASTRGAVAGRGSKQRNAAPAYTPGAVDGASLSDHRQRHTSARTRMWHDVARAVSATGVQITTAAELTAVLSKVVELDRLALHPTARLREHREHPTFVPSHHDAGRGASGSPRYDDTGTSMPRERHQPKSSIALALEECTGKQRPRGSNAQHVQHFEPPARHFAHAQHFEHARHSESEPVRHFEHWLARHPPKPSSALALAEWKQRHPASAGRSAY